LIWTNSMLFSKLCFFNTFSYVCFYHLSLRKTKNPRVFNPRVLEVCYVSVSYITVPRTLRFSGVRSYDRLPPLIDNQEQAITPASLGIVLNC
jgi:hypothetical protein